jgi:hypothetical protein
MGSEILNQVAREQFLKKKWVLCKGKMINQDP